MKQLRFAASMMMGKMCMFGMCMALRALPSDPFSGSQCP